MLAVAEQLDRAGLRGHRDAVRPSQEARPRAEGRPLGATPPAPPADHRDAAARGLWAVQGVRALSAGALRVLDGVSRPGRDPPGAHLGRVEPGPPVGAGRCKAARAVGIDPLVNLIFSESPKHTDEYYAERARQAAGLDVFRLCLKDPGGLLTPERMRTLVPAILANANGKYVELHSHCTTGLGPLNALEAVQLGIRTVNVGVPPLANGTALPSVFNIASNLRAMGLSAGDRRGAAADRRGAAHRHRARDGFRRRRARRVRRRPSTRTRCRAACSPTCATSSSWWAWRTATRRPWKSAPAFARSGAIRSW